MPTDGDTELRERPVGDLVKQLSEQTTTLVRKEIELAKAELAIKGKRAGAGAATLILALAEAVTPWLAALIVAAVYSAVGGVMALQGKKKVQAATPPVPEQAVDSTKEDVAWVKTRAKTARQ